MTKLIQESVNSLLNTHCYSLTVSVNNYMMRVARISAYSKNISQYIDIYGDKWIIVDGPSPKPCFDMKDGYLMEAMTLKHIKINVPAEAVLDIVIED